MDFISYISRNLLTCCDGITEINLNFIAVFNFVPAFLIIQSIIFNELFECYWLINHGNLNKIDNYWQQKKKLSICHLLCIHRIIITKAVQWSQKYIFNSFPLMAACMRQWTGSALVQKVDCRLLGAIIWTNAKILLIEPLGTKWSEILIEIYSFSF